ncbi:MAG: hypothetical protein SF123_01370 [Chloroflexota bacterium]|nr:hypothetical protein [Chloroflexota bacterium]
MKLQFITLLMMFASFTAAGYVRGQTMQGYAIAQQSQPGEIEILLLTGTESGDQFARQISINGEWVLSAVDASPESPWVALAFRTASAYAVSTYNVFTEQFNVVQTDVTLPPAPIGLMAPSQDIAISPNGRYLAYNVFEPGGTIQQNIIAHDIEAGNVIQLEDANGITSQLAWSEDSDRLAVAVTFCTISCTAALNIYRSNTWTLEKSIDLGAIPEAATSSTSGVCQLAWSPGGQYLSFMANCASVDYGLNKEIYVAEVALSTVSRITDYTYRQVRTEPLFAVFAEYSTV